MAAKNKGRHFLFPSFTLKLLLRASFIAILSYLFFSQICIPIYIRGESMDPAYRNGGVNFIWRLGYTFSGPKRYDVVAVRLAGPKVMLLKRVVALEGEWVEFREGKLLIDGKKVDEPYVRYPCTWSLAPRQVDKDSVYVVGDNRSMPIESHYFGQTSIRRIVGVPVW